MDTTIVVILVFMIACAAMGLAYLGHVVFSLEKDLVRARTDIKRHQWRIEDLERAWVETFVDHTTPTETWDIGEYTMEVKKP